MLFIILLSHFLYKMKVIIIGEYVASQFAGKQVHSWS